MFRSVLHKCIAHKVHIVCLGFLALHVVLVVTGTLVMVACAHLPLKEAFILSLTSDSSLGYRSNIVYSAISERIADIEAIVGMLLNSVCVSLAVMFVIRPPHAWSLSEAAIFDPEARKWRFGVQCSPIVGTYGPSATMEVTYGDSKHNTRPPAEQLSCGNHTWAPGSAVEVSSEIVSKDVLCESQLRLAPCNVGRVTKIVVVISGNVTSMKQHESQIIEYHTADWAVRCGKLLSTKRGWRIGFTKKDQCSSCDFVGECGLMQWIK
jgi:hypothetical protein